MYECEICLSTFYDRWELSTHVNAYGHGHECESCYRVFLTQRACNQHMNATDHWAPRYDCDTCSSTFTSQNAANQHMQDRGHWKNYCAECDRRFQNENNLRMHLNSKTHRANSICCPFCKATYTVASGLIHHLERGSCPAAPNLNRETILRFTRQMDRNGSITIRQIEWKDEEVSYSATDHAFNGTYWECYICHRMFKSHISPNQHLNSPAHKQNVYHCPNMKSACGKEFSTLAALFNRLESETCSFIRFEKVQRSVHNVIQGRGLLT
ncbi:hypothetical protein FE257_002106 [Aspergillus nanangensis]|uniref:C2H2-type domain-containing protein n=1 Tax=Aspergillus nanangensis TaxID=2582783 RepID=A0AAD4CTA9_ASPNN|nr:hypothetical protein FE257_002106 [Aspergillus nanangensis]